MKLRKILTTVAFGGLAAIAVAGCMSDSSGNSDYTRVVHRPADCVEVISAGSSVGGIADTQYISVDWISCYNGEGDVVIYRMPKVDGETHPWYSTTIKK